MIDWNDLYEKFKNKQLGRDQLEIIKKGIADDYNSNPDLQRLVQGVGNFYQDLKTVEGEEKYNPLNYLTAGTLRAMEGAGWLADQTAGRFLKDTIHNTLRVDPSVAEIGSQGVLMFAAPKAISKGIGLVNKAIASPQAKNLAYKAGQSARRLKNKLGSVPTTAYDDAIGIFELPSQEFKELGKLAKQPGINSLTLARRFQLQKQALKKKYGNIKSDPQGMSDTSKYQPPENFSGITPPTFDQARQKINRAIGNDVFIRHADGVPRFDFVKLQNNKVFTSEYKRLIGSDISTIDEFGLPFAKRRRNVPYQSRKAAFVNYRKELMEQYLEWYGPAMKRLGIKDSDIDLDHRLTLIQSLGIYHNVDPKSQLWIDIQNTAVRRGVYPGDAKRNLDLADPESHRVKSNYFNDLHGLTTHNNMKYWGGQHRNSGKTRLQIMEESHLGPEYEKLHLEVVNDYFDVAERGNKILDSARAMWKAENLKGILPEEIVTTLMQVSIDPKYTTKQLDQIVKSMMDVEIEKYRKFQRLFQIEEELDLINASPETILDTDPQDIKDLKKEWKQLKTVRKSKWFKKHYEKMMEIRDKEIASPQRNIFELLEFLFPEPND